MNWNEKTAPQVPPFLKWGLGIGILSLFIPLLRDLHWESAGLASLMSACGCGVLSASGTDLRGTARRTGWFLTGWFLPLLVAALPAGCFSLEGLAFWLSGPLPSAWFGWTAGRLARQHAPRRARLVTLLLIVLFALLPVGVRFFTSPQLYFYNHVWSYWPGPIYDELVPFDLRLPLFRFMTLLWGVLFFLLVDLSARRHQWLALGCSMMLISGWLMMPALGLVSPEKRIERELGGLIETEHFRIWYSRDLDPEGCTGDAEASGYGRVGTGSPGSVADGLQQLAHLHEDHLHEILKALELDPSIYRKEKIHSYLYRDARQKKYLTGAGQTSFVPVWIRRDQTHIACEHLALVLKHELVHVVAKQFAGLFGASPAIGLVEGVAVALDTTRSGSVDRLVAAREEWPDSDFMRELLSPLGFYRMAGPVSYSVSGSFVRHLLEHYPPEQFRNAYRTGKIEEAYHPFSLEELVGSWHTYLATLEVTPEDRERSLALFSTPSLFDKPCPRVRAQRELAGTFPHPLPADPGTLNGHVAGEMSGSGCSPAYRILPAARTQG